MGARTFSLRPPLHRVWLKTNHCADRLGADAAEGADAADGVDAADAGDHHHYEEYHSAHRGDPLRARDPSRSHHHGSAHWAVCAPSTPGLLLPTALGSHQHWRARD